MVVSVREFVFVTIGSVALSLGVLAAVFPWARNPRRLVAIAIATALGIVAWNVALNIGNATGFNVDSAFLGLSLQDVGSGVLAFATTALVLGLVTDRSEPAGRIVGTSAIVGLVTMVVDLFG
jgi:hypothetical protein